ncbi:MAG: diacylglycerol/lipid kinase family protein [Bacteroidia bacterium]
MAKTLFLINPFSGKIRQVGVEKVIRLVEDTYKKQKAQVEVRKIDFEQLDTWLLNAPNEGFQHIFAVGGDGTANALGAKLVNTSLNMGIIPMGSGNGFARNIGFSVDLALAIRQSVRPQVLKVDTGMFGKHFFLNVAGVGIDADISARYASSTTRGILPYITNTTKSYFHFQPETYTLIVDGKEHTFEEVWAAGVTNGTQWGYNFKMSPESLLTDGVLEVLIIKKVPVLGMPNMLRNALFGNIDKTRYVERLHGRHVILKRAQAGIAQVDGEAIEEGAEIDIRIFPKSLNLLLPNTITLNKMKSL